MEKELNRTEVPFFILCYTSSHENALLLKYNNVSSKIGILIDFSSKMVFFFFWVLSVACIMLLVLYVNVKRKKTFNGNVIGNAYCMLYGKRKAYCVECVSDFHVFHFNDNQSIKLCVHLDDIKGSTTLYTTHSTLADIKSTFRGFLFYFVDNT